MKTNDGMFTVAGGFAGTLAQPQRGWASLGKNRSLFLAHMWSKGLGNHARSRFLTSCSPPRHSTFLSSLLIIYVLLSTICWVAAAEDIGTIPVEVNGDQVEYFEGEKKIVGQGNVVVTYKDIRMTSKKVTAFLDSKEATAEGDVVITKGEDILKGKKIIYNFQTETGTIIEGAAKADVWYGGGKELNKISKDEIDIKDGYITTCDLDKPHYSIRSRQVKIYLGKRIVARNVTFNVGRVPVMYLPVYSQPVKENFPKVNIIPAYDKKFGASFLSSYRYNLTENSKGNVHLDYRKNKGLGEGVDYSFKTKDFGKGYLRTYYMNERDKVAHTKRERWRAQYRYKWDIRPNTTATLEYHKLSDKNFTKDYFYREEFERDSQPESYVSLIHARPAYTASLFAKKRVDRFFTDLERLPEAELNIRNQKLFEKLPFFYKGDWAVANLNKKTANSDQDNNAIRADIYDQISVPFRVINFLSVDPYAGARETFYTRETDTDKEKFRSALYAGLDVSTNFYRIYDCRTDFLNLDIDGVRHIFTPNISYYYVQKPTVEREKLFEFDDIDKLDKKRGIGLTFENKLQTKSRPLPEMGGAKRLDSRNELNTTELARFILGTDYLFRLEEKKDRLSDITSDLELRPYSWLFMKQTALYDPKWKDLKSLNTDLNAIDPKDKWRFGLGHRYEEKTSSQITTQTEARITPKWKCRIFEMFEFKGNDLKEQEYSITRDLHCWEAEFTYSVRDAHTFWLIFRLKALPELPLKLGTSYYRPKTGAQNE